MQNCNEKSNPMDALCKYLQSDTQDTAQAQEILSLEVKTPTLIDFPKFEFPGAELHDFDSMVDDDDNPILLAKDKVTEVADELAATADFVHHWLQLDSFDAEHPWLDDTDFKRIFEAVQESHTALLEAWWLVDQGRA